MRIGRSGISCLAAMLVTGTAIARPSCGPPKRGGWGLLRPVEAVWSDLNPLAGGSRLVPIDLRQDWDFETLYRVGSGQAPGRRTVLGTGYFARRHAGVTAVFPRSVYAPDGAGGPVAVIPPDTTFVIGEANRYTAGRIGLWPPPGGPVRDASGGLRLDARLSLRIETETSPHPLNGRFGAVDDPLPARAGGESPPRVSDRRGVAALLRAAGENERRGRRR